MSQQTPNKRVLFVRRSVPALLVLFGVFSLLLINFRSPRLAQAATSSTINFQARLETSAGAIAPDGNYNVEFKLYNAASTGTAEWTEDYTYNSGSGGTDARVRVANGYLSVSLGSITPFPNTIDWTQPQWITMNIGGTVSSGTITWDGEMSPRLQLTAVPYAFASGQLQTTSGSNTSTLSIQAPTGGSQTFLLQNQGAAGTYNLLTQNASTGIATLGTASTLTGKLAFANAGSANTITLATAAETVGSATITIPNTAGANDTICLQTLANCGSSFSLGTYSTTNTDAHGATLSAGVLTFQDASATAPGMVGTGAQTFAGNKTFSGSTTLNNTTLTAGTSITITGGNTASRPASPTEGMLYYDTTTHSLLVYSNGKWQADRTTATKIVGMGTTTGCTGTSPVASSNADAADYVVTSCTSAQTTINSAIAALPVGGGTVYLMEGTYIIDGTINLPGNVTLSGAGPATIIKLKDGINASVNAITNAANSTSGLTASVTNLALDGNKANNTSGTQMGISISTGTNATNFTIANITANNFRNSGLYIRTSVSSLTVMNSTFSSNGSHGIENDSGSTYFSNVVITSNGGEGIFLNSSGTTFQITNSYVASNTSVGIGGTAGGNYNISNNYVVSNGGNGIDITSHGGTISGNTVTSNSGVGVHTSSPTNVTITGNTISSNTGAAYNTQGGTNIVLSSNVMNNNGSGSNDAINFGGISSVNNIQIIGNQITSTTTGYGININSLVSNAYLANNTYSGSGAAVQDLGKGTVYANQQDANGNSINKGLGGFTIGTTTVNGTLSLQGGITAAALSSPAAPSLATAGTAGSTSYTYAVTALDGTGETLASTTTTIATGNATLSGTNYIKVTFSPVAGATSYRIYRTASGGSPATTGYIGTVTSTGATSYTLNDTGLAASGSTPASNTTGGGTFTGALQGASGTLTSGTLTLGTASTSTGSVKFYSASGSGSVTLTLTNPGTTNYTLSIPALTGNDTICTVGAANCTGGSGSGVTSIGTYNSQTASANGAVISGTTLFLQSASGSTPGLIDGNNQSFSGNKTFSGILTASATGGNAVAITGAPTNSATSSLIQIGSAISGGNASANGGTYIGLNAPSSGAGSAADFLNFEQAGTSNFQVTSNGFIWSVGGLTTNGNITVQGASTLSVGGTINTTSGYQFNGTSGATTTCSSGQFLQNQVVKGGISTGGTCAAAVTTVGAFSATSIANGASISGNTITFGPADGTNPGMVTAGPQTLGGAKTFSSLITGNAGLTVSGGNISLTGTTSITINGAAATTYTIGDTNTTGTMTFGQSTASNTINLGNAATTTTQTINIGSGATGAGADAVTVGSTNGASATTIQAGTGNLKLLTNSASSSIILKTNTNSTTAFQVQNSSSNMVLGVDTSANQVLFGKASTVNASLLLYNSTNANTVTIQSGATSASYAITLPTAIGTAGQCLAVSSVGSGNESLGYASCGGSGGGGGHAKKIILTPEYAGAVLDAMSDGSCSSANNGTMTSGYDSLNRTNFYNWMSSTSPSQCYDVVVQVPIPSDWSSWAANPLSVQLLGSSSNANYAIQILNSSGSADTTFCASSYCTPGALSTSWGNMTSTSSFAATGYAADGYLTIKVRMVALNSAYVQLGNITLSYNSAY